MNIYVGNLSYGVSDDQLREVFEAYGTVSSAKVIQDKYSGRSKGFGFVEMDDDSAATKAIEVEDKDKLKYPIPGKPGEYYKHRMDMENLKKFDRKRGFIDALSYIGVLPE